MRQSIIIALLMLVFLIGNIGLANAISYTYDSLNRLESVDYENGYTIQYSYDNNGNITSCIQSIPNVTPLSPQFVTIIQSANQIDLSWEAVNENVNGNPIIVEFYRIEYSDSANGPFSVLGTSTQTSYIDSNPTSAMRFYRIKAVINESRSSQSVLQKRVKRNTKKK
jgi:hypothetical protein